jgi:hypothetical protein
MKTLQISAAVPRSSWADEAPMSPDQLKRVAAPPKLGLAKYRRLPPTPENIRAYGDAVCEAMRELQRRELLAQTRGAIDTCPCASGTWHSDGAAILKAVRQQHAGHIRRALEAEHAARTDHQVKLAYAAAMIGGPDADKLVNSFKREPR